MFFLLRKYNLQHSCEMKTIHSDCWKQSLNYWDTEGLLWNKDPEVNSCLRRKANMLMCLPPALFPSCEGRTSCDGDSVTSAVYLELTDVLVPLHTPNLTPLPTCTICCIVWALEKSTNFKQIKKHKDIHSEYRTVDHISKSLWIGLGQVSPTSI